MSAPLTWTDSPESTRPSLTPWEFCAAVLEPLASLKLTVVLFSLAIFIIFAGTLAQVDRDIWDVIRLYFRAPIAWIPPGIFFPPSFFPASIRPTFPDWLAIPFPGGWMIGAVMALNLVAAHLVRFQVHARGMRLAVGLGVIVIGGVLTWLVIVSGSNKEGLQQQAAISYDTLWNIFRVAIVFCCVPILFVLPSAWRLFNEKLSAWRSGQTTFRDAFLHFQILRVVLLLLAWVALLWYFTWGERLNDSAMRILWQLSKGSFAGLVLLAGCGLVFGKRAGVVLLHGGIGLMMFGELLVGMTAVEGQMPIEEGQTVNYVRDIRTWELAITNSADAKEDHVTIVPKGAVMHAFDEKQPIADPKLPFRIEVVELLPNSEPRELKPGETSLATKGLGTSMTVDKAKPVSGTDDSGRVDQTSAFLKLTANDGEDLGTYLVGLTFSMLDFQDEVTVGDQTYRIALRFKRTYKPYSLTLADVRKDDYIGTDTPRNYSSDVVLNDPTRNVSDREVKIWMNNPLRFAGETFYQSGYNKDMRTGKEITTLSVVTNTGWLIPYVSCMIVMIGMLAHFSITLSRFLQRASRQETAGETASEVDDGRKDPRRKAAKTAAPAKIPEKDLGMAGWAVPWGVVTIAAIVVAMEIRRPEPQEGEFDLYRFGQLPVVADGRSKPIDTLARHTMLAISGKSTWVDENEVRQPAVKWFLDMVATPQAGAKHHVLRIENLEVQELLGLPRREGFRYGFDEIFENFRKFMTEAEKASKVPANQQSVYQRKLLELKSKIDVFEVLINSFGQPPIQGEGEQFSHSVIQQMQRQQALKAEHPPLAIPPLAKDQTWETYANGWLWNLVAHVMPDRTKNPFVEDWDGIFSAYEQRDESAFNSAVAKLHRLYREQTPAEVDLKRVEFESYFNRIQLTTLAIVLYVTAFVIAALGWLCLAFDWRRGWRLASRTAFSLTAFTLIIHTLALIARMYISGRPPVTNLYSSAVFIGWGCVVLGLILEGVFRVGFGNVVATVAGYSTLLIAYTLEQDGSDTFSVMQAVLDTQFWLATHVTCITLGYATTYLAGLFGILYVLLGVCTPRFTPQLAKDLTRMTYGTLCFSIFFSFVGTVLGGLWADDSWGRFWGWDPKENGALMIVLWNALILHARWGGLVKERGLAVLAVAGNIVVSWSWFGVNLLSVGLHAYGFNQRIFTTFWVLTLIHLPIIALGLIPREKWLSRNSGGGTLAA